MESDRESPVLFWHPSRDVRICVARGLRLWRCKAAWDAVCDVDAAGVIHSRRHRHHSLFYFAQAHAETVPWLLSGCSVRICILSALWNGAATHLPELRTSSVARLGKLPELRDKHA